MSGLAPFSAPSTDAETREQLRRLWRKVQDFKSRVKPLPEDGTEATKRLNEMIRHIRGWVEG